MVFAVVDKFATDDWDAERVDEFRKFIKQAVRLGALFITSEGPDEQGALDHLWLFLDLKHPKPRDIASVAASPQGGRGKTARTSFFSPAVSLVMI
jgi:hypothetical protein